MLKNTLYVMIGLILTLLGGCRSVDRADLERLNQEVADNYAAQKKVMYNIEAFEEEERAARKRGDKYAADAAAFKVADEKANLKDLKDEATDIKSSRSHKRRQIRYLERNDSIANRAAHPNAYRDPKEPKPAEPHPQL